jgi:acetyl-CoA carboxylase carboxyl transferase subunit alpha
MPEALGFEQPLLELETRIAELAARDEPGTRDEIARLQARLERLRQKTFAGLTAWQTTQLARHPRRPHTRDLCRLLFDDFIELHGDRVYGDDPAIVAGLARFEHRSVVVVGHQKGRETREKIARNFGMPHPEGYRKALRVMQLAARFAKPVITFIDTPGAYPGIGAEERGQAEAIARNLREMAALPTPLVAVVTGEGGSGGALAIGLANRVLMLQHAVYSVISPEGCAAILWGDAARAPEAAEIMKITAPDLLRLGVIDAVVPEPPGGAHRDWEGTAASLRGVLRAQRADQATRTAEALPSPPLTRAPAERPHSWRRAAATSSSVTSTLTNFPRSAPRTASRLAAPPATAMTWWPSRRDSSCSRSPLTDRTRRITTRSSGRSTMRPSAAKGW